MTRTAASWRPIGAVLVESGAITQAQLEGALAEQRVSGKRVGEILIDRGAITWLTLAHAISEQAPDVETVRPEVRLQTVEAMLNERKRAFLELVSTTEKLRRTVARLEDELAARDSEIAKLRNAPRQ
jgi:hypothetical protein